MKKFIKVRDFFGDEFGWRDVICELKDVRYEAIDEYKHLSDYVLFYQKSDHFTDLAFNYRTDFACEILWQADELPV